jgi:hypothetical protein
VFLLLDVGSGTIDGNIDYTIAFCATASCRIKMPQKQKLLMVISQAITSHSFFFRDL